MAHSCPFSRFKRDKWMWKIAGGVIKTPQNRKHKTQNTHEKTQKAPPKEENAIPIQMRTTRGAHLPFHFKFHHLLLFDLFVFKSRKKDSFPRFDFGPFFSLTQHPPSISSSHVAALPPSYRPEDLSKPSSPRGRKKLLIDSNK